ncbi:MAG: hypothetical protein ACJ8FY_13030 [Gemmataceae bacterium]
MDRLHDFLTYVKDKKLAQGNFLGLLHVLIGRTVQDGNGESVSNGVTWRELAAWLQKVRWDKDAVRDLGVDPEELPPKDRQRFWFMAFARANLDSPKAGQAGDRFAQKLRAEGYNVGTGPKK